MIKNMGVLEWALIAIVVILIFGVGRLTDLGRDLGQGIREFRRGLTGDDDGGSEGEGEE